MGVVPLILGGFLHSGAAVGRIYETQSALVLVDDHHRPMTRSGRVTTLEEAKAQLRKSWDAWKSWAKIAED